MRPHHKLLEHSGFTQFVDAFVDWTRRHDNEHHHLAEIKDTVKSIWYEPVIDRLKGLVGAGGGSEAEPLRESERTLIGQKNRLHGVAYSMVESEVSKIRSHIGELMRNSGSREEADQRLRCVLQPVLERIERWLNEELNGISASLAVTIETPEMSEEQRSVTAEQNTAVRGIVAEQVSKLGDAVTNKELVKGALLTGRGMKAFGIRDILGLKGKWTRTLDKWAGGFTKVARGGLVVLQVVIAIWEAKRADDWQKKENQEMRLQAVGSQQAIESICGGLRGDLVRDIDDIIENTLGAAIVRIREQLAKIRTESSEQEQHYQELLDRRSELEGISFTSTQTGAPTEEPA